MCPARRPTSRRGQEPAAARSLSTHRAVVELVTASRDVPALLCAGATWIDRPAVVEFAAAAPAIAARRGGAVPVVARAWPATRATVIPAAGRSPAGLVVRARMSRAAALGGPSRRPVVFPAPLTWGPAAFPRLVVPAGTAHHSPPFTLYVAHGNSFRPSLTAHRHHPTRRLTDRSTPYSACRCIHLGQQSDELGAIELPLAPSDRKPARSRARGALLLFLRFRLWLRLAARRLAGNRGAAAFH